MDFDTDIRPAQIINGQSHSEWEYGCGPTLGAIIGVAGAAMFVAWIIKLVLERWS